MVVSKKHLNRGPRKKTEELHRDISGRVFSDSSIHDFCIHEKYGITVELKSENFLKLVKILIQEIRRICLFSQVVGVSLCTYHQGYIGLFYIVYHHRCIIKAILV